MSTNDENSSKFAVILDGIKLPQQVEKAIESEIKQVVMKHLAMTDLSVGAIVPNYRFPRGWLGMPVFNPARLLQPDQLNMVNKKIQQQVDSAL